MLHYMRIPKTGSSSMLSMLKTAKGRRPDLCANLTTHWHNFTAHHLKNSSKSFTILREPCSRFASVFDYLRGPKKFDFIVDSGPKQI